MDKKHICIATDKEGNIERLELTTREIVDLDINGFIKSHDCSYKEAIEGIIKYYNKERKGQTEFMNILIELKHKEEIILNINNF